MNINSEPIHHYTKDEDGAARWNLYWLPVVVTGEQSPRKVVALLGHESQIQGYTRYTNPARFLFEETSGGWLPFELSTHLGRARHSTKNNVNINPATKGLIILDFW